MEDDRLDDRTTVVRIDRSQAQVVRIRLEGPRTKGALSRATFDALAAAVAEADADREVRVIVVTGSGDAFCSGFDLQLAATLPELSVEEMVDLQEAATHAILAVRRTFKPVIAAVGGSAAGAGFSLALAADICVAVPEATFNAAFVRIGFTGGDCGSSWLLPRAIGLARASEILLTGRLVSAEEAQRIGMISQVVPAAQLEPATAEIAAGLCRNSPLGIALTKRVLQTNVDAPSLEAAVELENRNQVLASRSEDFIEALDAFRQGREPRYRAAGI